MRTVDFTPLHRFAVGFDRMQRQFDQALSMDDSQLSYPPYNIEALSENEYRISMAVAGFGEEDLDVTVKENSLFITGKIDKKDEEVTYLHRGIAGRSFERRFELADHIKVVSANLENGLLHVELAREVPEEKKPRTIKISSGETTKKIESKAA